MKLLPVCPLITCEIISLLDYTIWVIQKTCTSCDSATINNHLILGVSLEFLPERENNWFWLPSQSTSTHDELRKEDSVHVPVDTVRVLPCHGQVSNGGRFLSSRSGLIRFSSFRSSNMQSGRTRSMKSVKIPWYQKPLITNNKYFDVQHGAMLVGVFALVSANIVHDVDTF